MLSRICVYLKNYFETERIIGDVVISDGVITVDGVEVELADGEYFALFHEHYAYGVFQNGADYVEDNSFRGAVWRMDVPDSILDAMKWALEWEAKNGNPDDNANSAFNSESFGGYTYTKAQSSMSTIGSTVFNNAKFKSMLAPYMRIRL